PSIAGWTTLGITNFYNWQIDAAATNLTLNNTTPTTITAAGNLTIVALGKLAIGNSVTPGATTINVIGSGTNPGSITNNTNPTTAKISCTGSLTNRGRVTLAAGSTAVNLSGNLVNNGTEILTASAWAFNRNITLSMMSAAQTIGGSQVTTFNDVTINN